MIFIKNLRSFETTILQHLCVIHLVPRLSLLYLTLREAKERESLGARLMHHTELSDPVTKRVMSHPSDHVTSTNCRTRAIVGEWRNFVNSKGKFFFFPRSTHCDQFFGRRRMNCHGIIKIFLCRPHFDRHGKTLQHLVTAYSKNMQTNNLRRKRRETV